MDVKELGGLLTKQRESLGYTVEDLSESTRISRSVLVTLEAGDVENYPHPVYAKGFIRNYARALSLDEEMCLRALEKELFNDGAVSGATENHPSLHDIEDSKPIVKSGSPWPVILGTIVFVALLGAMIWYFSFSGMYGPESSMNTPDQQEQTEEQVAAATPDAELQPIPVVAEQAGQDAMDGQHQSTEAPEGASQQAEHINLQASAGETPGQSMASGVPVQANDGLHTLVIEVIGDQPCWVGVWVPEQEAIAKDFTVPVGERVEYRFKGKRFIRFGRIETVKLTFDGALRPVQGRGVVNLTLP